MSMTGNTSKKQQLKIESGQTPAISDYLQPPPSDEPAPTPPPMSGYSSYLDPTTPGAQATFNSYFYNTAPLGADALKYSNYIDKIASRRQTPLLPEGGALEAGLGMQQAARDSSMDTGGVPFTSASGQYKPSFEEWAGIGTGGGGAARPDFSAYRAALTDQAQQINAQIQAMYNALGEEAGANVGRIQDIYGGASTGIGDVYGSAVGNVGDAYGSAQQQAADQLARLGIEAAAPAVINPMALSQAEAISQLEQGRAGGQAATERFGSAASGFGSQMAQVAQQQGTEMNAAILASLQNRLMDSLAAEQQGGGGGGGGGMSVRDQLALREAYNRDVLGELPLEEREFAFEQAQAAADPLNRFLASAQERVIESLFPSSGGKAAASPEELIQSEAAAYQQLRQALGLG